MGLISAILGNVSEVNPERLEKEFSQMLIEGEAIEHAFKMFRDLVVFTNLRLFMVDKQDFTGKKREYVAIPYRSIDYFSKETAGNFDLDAEISIWVKGRTEPILIEFKNDTLVHEVFRVLSTYVLK